MSPVFSLPWADPGTVAQNAHQRFHVPMIALKTAHSIATEAVTRRYAPPSGLIGRDRNSDRLRCVLELFGLSIGEVAKASGVSRPYVSRVLSGSLKASPAFWRGLEAGLGRLVEGRSGQVFEVEVTPADHAVGRMLEAIGSADSAER